MLISSKNSAHLSTRFNSAPLEISIRNTNDYRFTPLTLPETVRSLMADICDFAVGMGALTYISDNKFSPCWTTVSYLFLCAPFCHYKQPYGRRIDHLVFALLQTAWADIHTATR